MTVGAKLKEFFSEFSIPAYPVSSVPDENEITFPYLTYDAPTGFFLDGDTSCVVNLWYKTESESVPNEKAQEIADRIGANGCLLSLGNGKYIWVKRGSPWCQAIAEDDTSIKRRYINITMEFLV